VLFEFAGAFIDSPFPAFAASNRELGLDASRLIELTFGPLDEETDHPWHRVERGEPSILDAREEIIALGREILPLADLFDDVVDSSGLGVRKPDPATDRLALERLGGDELRSLVLEGAV
jgi:hypothetical protein